MIHIYRIITALFIINTVAYYAPCLAQKSQPAKIGVSIVLSGNWSSWGESLRKGVIFGAEQTTNKFDLDIQDDKCEAVNAVTNVKRFLEIDRTKLIVAGCVQVLEAIGPLAWKNKAIIFGLGGMHSEILQHNPNIVSLFSMTDNEARFLAPYLTSREEIKKVAIIHGSDVFGTIISKTLERLLKEKGVRVTSNIEMAWDTMDLKPVITRVLVENPDAIFVNLSDSAQIAAYRKFKEVGYKGEIYSNYGVESAQFKKAGGSALEGIRYTYPVNDSEGTEIFKTFSLQFQKKFGELPDINSQLGYDTMILLDSAVTRCGAENSECILQTFRSMHHFRGMAGELTINSDGSTLRPLGLKQIRNAQSVWLVEKLVAD